MMDIYALNWTSLHQKIFSLLSLKAGDKLSQREVAMILGVSPSAVGYAVPLLQKEGLISIEKIKIINFLFFNRDGKRALELKRAENLKNVYLSGLFDYLETTLAGATIIIFGSYSRGEDTNVSDIDIAVIGRKEKLLDLEKFEKILYRKIHISYYPSWKIDMHVRNNILNGIVLSGSVEG